LGVVSGFFPANPASAVSLPLALFTVELPLDDDAVALAPQLGHTGNCGPLASWSLPLVQILSSQMLSSHHQCCSWSDFGGADVSDGWLPKRRKRLRSNGSSAGNKGRFFRDTKCRRKQNYCTFKDH
jgi:hypothetical protein